MKPLIIFRFSLLPIAMAFTTAAVRAAILTNPIVSAEATAFSASFPGSNVFDNGIADYASKTLGANTFLEFNFGSAKAINGFVNVTRGNTLDVVGDSRLIFDTDGLPGFNALTDTVVNFNTGNTGNNGQGFVNRFASTTAQFARWEVLTSIGTSQNLGAMEMNFLNTPAGSTALSGVTVYNSATPFSGNFAAANAVNGIAGRGIGAGVEYASQGLGTNTFVDFDMGSTVGLSGFDFFDRIAPVDHVGTFDLIFSNDSTFATTVATRSITKGTTGAGPWTYSENFAPVNARYVRYDVTGTASTNAGLSEITFYTVPEPTSAACAALGSLLLLVRRRRA